MKDVDHLHSVSDGRPWTVGSRSLAVDSSSSRPDANSHCWPVTRFSRRPASASGFASPRTFTTYARRVGYLESVLKVILAVGSDGPIEVNAIRLGARRRRVVSETSPIRRRCVGGTTARRRMLRMRGH